MTAHHNIETRPKLQGKGLKLKIKVEFNPNRLSDERLIEAYEITVPMRSFNIGSEPIMSAKPTKRAQAARKRVTA
jgi:hypothetical protein